MAVPLDLQEQLGKKQIWRSLKTKHYDVARSEARKLILSFDLIFQNVRNEMDSRLINAMVADYGLRTIHDTDKARLGVKVSDNEEFNAYMLERAEGMRSVKDPEVLSKALAGISAMYQKDEVRGNHISVPYAIELANT
jgi:hypothetical protein